jgi:hypothetical protein
MRSISELIVQSKREPTNGAVVLSVFIVFVLAVMAIPGAMIWAANSLG